MSEFHEKRKQNLIQESLLPIRNLENINLIPEKQDIESFRQLSLIKDNIIKFVKDGYNLLLFSNNPGNGKTTWACKLGLAYIDYICNYATENPFLYINLPLYFDKRKAAIQDKSLCDEIQKIEHIIKIAKLIIFDDIGIRDLSEFEKQLLYIWIEYRTSNKLSCVYTSNIHPNNFNNIFGPRVADRILGYSTCIEIKGQSRRNDKNFLEVINSDSITGD